MRLLLQVRMQWITKSIVQADYTRLQRRVYWFEENEMKKADYDQIKDKSKQLLKDKERVERELKEVKNQFDLVRF